MKTQRVKQVFRDYLSGKSKAKERGEVDKWYQSFDAERIRPLSDEEEAGVKEDIWERIMNESGQGKVVKSFRLPGWLKAAALLVAVSAACWILLRKDGRSPVNARYTEITTGPKERKNIRLSDGTLLSLNAGSTIRIQDDFSKERRVTIIDGEVFFDVKTDPSRPFTVSSGKVTTNVLGTSFNVSAYQELSRLTVEVLSGKVKVLPGDTQSNILERGQQLVYDKKTKSVSVRNKKEDAAWTKGSLLFDDLSFDDMAVLMKKGFGVSIVAEDETIRKTTRYTTILPVTMSASEAVDILAAIHNLKVRRSNNVFYVRRPVHKTD
ncbi:FecR family protein [Pararcticibacter amylolyticus]|uniref:FecR protein domain-containing protein n=1 Tax=Pararcticibacter amylolyticus TaxID=2173175 RepID=A0A2U2PA28_9SPHI|nr:FecR domain-containing protein [Pararcticibacter amylolyticus]PWG78241.1 hypothetical protein DDR33_23315 [Pararcticibacter amylolyticus]